MNVTLEKVGNVNGYITVSIEANDYQDKVKKELKTIGLRHPERGFRPGHVPMALLQKKYGREALVETINREAYDALVKYIQDNKVNILGEPLPNEDKQPEIDFDTMEEFSFAFTPDKDGNVWLSFGGNWNEDPAARPFVLIDEVSINGEPLANGGFEDGFKGWGVGKNATVSSDAKAGGNAAKVNHDNNAGRNIKVEAGKSYTVKFFAKNS